MKHKNEEPVPGESIDAERQHQILEASGIAKPVVATNAADKAIREAFRYAVELEERRQSFGTPESLNISGLLRGL